MKQPQTRVSIIDNILLLSDEKDSNICLLSHDDDRKYIDYVLTKADNLHNIS